MSRMSDIKKTVFALPPKQRVQLAQEIWDSVADNTGVVSIPDEHLRLIREREAAHDRDPSKVIPWPQARRRLQRKLARGRAQKKSA